MAMLTVVTGVGLPSRIDPARAAARHGRVESTNTTRLLFGAVSAEASSAREGGVDGSISSRSVSGASRYRRLHRGGFRAASSVGLLEASWAPWKPFCCFLEAHLAALGRLEVILGRLGAM